MTKMYFYTQDFENYGTVEDPYWKAKGGSDFIIEADEWDAEMVNNVIENIEYSNDMSQRFLVGYQAVHDEFTTQDEQFELEYEGKIEFGAKRCSYQEFMLENMSFV